MLLYSEKYFFGLRQAKQHKLFDIHQGSKIEYNKNQWDEGARGRAGDGN
jgi:hypothetical protein